MELSVEEESMTFTAATFIVRYSPQLFNTPSDIRQQSDIIAEINNINFSVRHSDNVLLHTALRILLL